jgi:hypothetical protein
MVLQQAEPDRSEIGPYLGGHRTTSGWPKNPPRLSTSEVGRFLRKRQRKGTWNACKHATPADMDRSEIGAYLGAWLLQGRYSSVSAGSGPTLETHRVPTGNAH